MKIIVNKTARPLRIPLPRGKVLHLAPAKTGQLSDEALGQAIVREMLETGRIELIGDGAPGTETTPSTAVAASTHGHRPTKSTFTTGNR